MTKNVEPFFPIAASPTRPLGVALPALATPAVTSPWSPRAVASVVVAGPSAEQIAAIHDEARLLGRAEGLAEIVALRDRLVGLLATAVVQPAEIVAPAADLVAEVATCVIETWLGHVERSALFAPLVRSWLARSPAQPATARVHPDDAAALAETIGDALLTIVPDPTLAPGALEIRSATLELSHDWRARLDELRTAITVALTGAES